MSWNQQCIGVVVDGGGSSSSSTTAGLDKRGGTDNGTTMNQSIVPNSGSNNNNTNYEDLVTGRGISGRSNVGILTVPFEEKRDSRHNYRTRNLTTIFNNCEECRGMHVCMYVCVVSFPILYDETLFVKPFLFLAINLYTPQSTFILTASY